MDMTKILKQKELHVINMGLPLFYDEVKRQDIPCVMVDWRPPAGGNKKLIDIIDKLRERG